MTETQILPIEDILRNLTEHYAERSISVESHKDKLNVDLAYQELIWGFLDGNIEKIEYFKNMYERIKVYIMLGRVC